jgi:threonine synthase
MVPGLVCAACGSRFEAGPDEPWRCECGGPLEIDADPLPDGPPASLDRDRGLWAFDSLLPVERRVTLGEGFTPLVDAPAWEAAFKLEYVFPSGSFKDRGATTTLSRAAGLGVERVVEDSSGNAGAAIAQYAARAGIDADVYVPAGVKASKLAAIEGTGATAVRVEGSRQAVTDACVAAVEEEEAAWYASHAWNPAFFAGTATFAYEIAGQRGWSVPDAIVLPLGHGTLFLGAYRGFRRLERAGWTDGLPRLLGVQAEGVAPIVEALHGSGGTTATNDAADGIQITEPARRQQVLDAIEATDGDAIALGADETESARGALHRAGFYVEPTSAIAVAGLEAYRKNGTLSPDADVVVPLTGTGLKT